MTSLLSQPMQFAAAASALGDQHLLNSGRAVIEAEASALLALAASLDAEFARAVSLLLDPRGRIVVTGMGKSGHIGRKFVATLSSTGSPALFLHPAEAAHGDLGVLVSGDVLIVLSNSGGTLELRPIIMRAKLLGIPVIGIASRPESLLMRHSDVRLLMPVTREASPDDVAPTTSSIMMLALADALAIAAMEQRGISRECLHALHPGGNIGLRLAPIAALMHERDRLPLVLESAPMRDVIVTMTEKSFGVAGVIDGAGRLIGVITDGDLRRNVDRLFDSAAHEVMTSPPVTIPVTGVADQAIALLQAHKITSLFVTGGDASDRPVGLVHVHDFLRLGLVSW